MVPVRSESGLVRRSLADSPPDSAGLWRTLAGLRGPVKIIGMRYTYITVKNYEAQGPL